MSGTSYAWDEVLQEATLRPWLALVEDTPGNPDKDIRDRNALDDRIRGLQIALLDGQLSQEEYEIRMAGSQIFFSDECRLTFTVLEQSAWLALAGNLVRALAEWDSDKREELTIEMIHPTVESGGQIAAIRFRYFTRAEFQMFCQILMVVFQGIPV